MNPILVQIKEQAAALFARQFFDEYKKIGVLNPDFRPLYSSGQLLKIAAEGDAAHEELKKRGEEERERGEKELEAAFGKKTDSSYSGYSQDELVSAEEYKQT